jgi:hypothetical protein
MRFLSHLTCARLLLYVCCASTGTAWAHISHTQTQTHTQAETHAPPCANPYGAADCNPIPDHHCHGYGNAHTHRYAASRCSDLGAALSEWDGQILD